MWEYGYCIADLEGKQRLIIDYYHPSCHFPKKMTYYALLSYFQIAMQEKNKQP